MEGMSSKAQRPGRSTTPSATRCGRSSGSPTPARRRGADRAAEGAEVEKLFAELAEADVVVRGVYDVSGLRADADLMVWWHAADLRGAAGGLPPLPPYGVRPAPRAGLVADGAAPAGGVQQAATCRRSSPTRSRRSTSASTRSCAPTSGTSSRTPSAAGCSPSTARWRATTPTSAPTRSPASRSATTSGSSPSRPTTCYRIVDLMRHLRGSEARRHVREEVPFYTGARVGDRRAGRPAALSRREPGPGGTRVPADVRTTS